MESLEAGQLLALYIVDTAQDVIDPEDGLTSIREAIADDLLSPDGRMRRFELF